MIKSVTICVLGVIVLIGSGCTDYPKLKLTEVAGGTVELYLDEANQLNLRPFSLGVATGAGHNISLNLLGTMPAGSYLVIFEEIGYTGQPVSVTYTDPFTNAQCAGIKVAESYFGWNLGGTSFAYGISGESGRPSGLPGLFATTRIVDDVVTFGTRPRPSIGGDFTEDTSAPISLPVPPSTVSRKWGTSGPIDNNLESDWKNAFPTLCGQTQ